MKHGVLQFFSWPNRRGELPQVYQRALERIKIMDQTGFDAVWLAEHHFSTYSVCPSVHIMGMHVADITQNIRIGTAVSLAAFYHPLRLAEEVAFLDQLSGGRVNWGAGRGFDRTEMQVFDVEHADSYPKFHENVEIVLKAWEDGPLTYHGQYHQFDEVEVLPKPYQNPVPVWIACSSDKAIQWSGQKGFSVLMDPHSSHAEIKRKFDLYQSELKANNHEVVGRDIPMARLLAIADTDEAAEQIAYNGSQWMFGSYFNAGQGSTQTASKTGTDPQQRLDEYVSGSVIHGCPERVADILTELEETLPLNYLMTAPLSNRTFIQFVDEVLPRIN